MLFAIDNPHIYRYIEEHISHLPGDEMLCEIERFTYWNTVNSRMLSGKIQARILQFFCNIKRPKKILEIGTFTGYSAIAMANVIDEDATIYSLDTNDEYLEIAKRFVDKANLSKKIKLVNSDVKPFVDNNPLLFDFIFIDGEKDEYIHYFETSLPYLAEDGIILADNTLWSGKILDDNATDKKTKHLREFNKMVSNDTRIKSFILPVRDGLTIIMKK